MYVLHEARSLILAVHLLHRRVRIAPNGLIGCDTLNLAQILVNPNCVNDGRENIRDEVKLEAP